MKKMIRMAMTAAVMVAAVTTVASAQDAQQQGRRGGGRGGFPMAILDSLKATDVQKAKVDSIVKVYQTLNAPLMEAMRGGDADARTKMQENRAKQTEAIKSVLTDEQKKQFDALMAQMGGRRGGGL
jgi:Spy/CpxP family protein refolding chaperone